jgi:LmbE family N-acetylglucosaminyl deacetylase
VANPYRRHVENLAALLREGRSLPLGGIAAPRTPTPPRDAPRALVFAPHPDDECIVGLLALRLLREAGMRVVDVAVTQGSNRARRAERWDELRAACEYLGFDLVATAPGGLERIDPATRAADPAHWTACVEIAAGIVREHSPAVVFCPHDADWNKTHVGTHHLVMDALARVDHECTVVETEYWGAMATPNLVVEASADDLADLMAALSFHAGEVRRNPYHLGLPAWMQDNVRRGAEVAGGQGQAAPAFDFATLYRVWRWKDGRRQPAAPPRVLPAATNAAAVIAD